MKLASDDESLIADALKGSSYAWEKLVKRYETRIYNYGLRLTGNATDAMDLMQEVFLGVYRNLHRFRGDAKFSSWLFRIAHNKAVDLNRRKKLLAPQNRTRLQEEQGDEFDFVPGPDSNEPDMKLGLNEKNQAVRKMLMTLSMEQRLLVELKIYQSQTFEEIAHMQDISENTAKTRYYSALRKLKVALEEDHVLS